MVVPPAPGDVVMTLQVEPGAEQWQSVPGRVERFLVDHTSDPDLQTDVAVLLTGTLEEMLDHQGHRGALVTVTVDPRDTVEVEVFAGSSHRDQDAVDPAHLAVNAAVLVADAVTTAAAAVAAAAAKAARAAEVERHQRLTAVTLARLMRSNELLRDQVSRIDAHAVR